MLRTSRRAAYEAVIQLDLLLEKMNQERELGDMQVEDKTEEEWESEEVEDTLLHSHAEEEEEPKEEEVEDTLLDPREEGEVGQDEDTLRLMMGLAAAEFALE